jgi:hypothetical protein
VPLGLLAEGAGRVRAIAQDRQVAAGEARRAQVVERLAWATASGSR